MTGSLSCLCFSWSACQILLVWLRPHRRLPSSGGAHPIFLPGLLADLPTRHPRPQLPSTTGLAAAALHPPPAHFGASASPPPPQPPPALRRHADGRESDPSSRSRTNGRGGLFFIGNTPVQPPKYIVVKISIFSKDEDDGGGLGIAHGDQRRLQKAVTFAMTHIFGRQALFCEHEKAKLRRAVSLWRSASHAWRCVSRIRGRAPSCRACWEVVSHVGRGGACRRRVLGKPARRRATANTMATTPSRETQTCPPHR